MDIDLKEVVRNFKLTLSFTLRRRLKLLFVFHLKNYEFASQEREIIEDLLEEDLLPDGWYLVLHYKLIEVEVAYFKHNNITEFVLAR